VLKSQYFPSNSSNFTEDKKIYSTIVPKNGRFLGYLSQHEVLMDWYEIEQWLSLSRDTSPDRYGPGRPGLSQDTPGADMGIRLPARWPLENQSSGKAGIRTSCVPLVVSDGVGIADAGTLRVTRIVADGARVESAGPAPIAGVVSDALAPVEMAGKVPLAGAISHGTQIVLAGTVPDAGAISHGTLIARAGKVPVAGVILDVTLIAIAGKVPVAGVILDVTRVATAGVGPTHTGVLPDIRHPQSWEQQP